MSATATARPLPTSNTFKCTTSTHHGFLTIAPNKRYWQYSDGTSFYGVGLWYNDNYTAHGQGVITEEGLDGLKQHGANFICFYPSPLETFATGLGRYDLDRAGRLDELFDWCEKRDLAIAWNLVFHAQISEEVWGRGNTEYRAEPLSHDRVGQGFLRQRRSVEVPGETLPLHHRPLGLQPGTLSLVRRR